MRKICSFAVAVAIATPAFAGDRYVIQPTQIGNEQVRYVRGEATVVLDQEAGSVQIQPLGFDHGSLSFSVAVMNGGQTPFNMDLSSVAVRVNGQPVGLFTRQDLEKKAKRRAMWGNLAIALAGGLAAASAASQRDHYRATTYTPYGTYRTFISTPSAAGQVQATAIAAGTGYALAERQKQLQYTLENLAVDIVQLTTVSPGDSYGGRVVLQKLKFDPKVAPSVTLTVNMNGVEFPFAFRVVKPGTPVPVFRQPAVVPAAVVPPGPPAEPSASPGGLEYTGPNHDPASPSDAVTPVTSSDVGSASAV